MMTIEHQCFVTDSYMQNGFFGSCVCGWKTPIYRYRWVWDTYGVDGMKEFHLMIKDQFEEAHKDLE